MNKKKIFTSAILATLLLLSIPSVALAAPPNPSIGTAVVDGNPAEWNLSADFFADMYRAGDDGKVVESKLYLRYNPATQTLYVLVLSESGVPALKLPDDAWVAIDGISNKVVNGNSGNDGTPPDFAWVNPTTDNADGFEASFILPIGEYELIVHMQVYNDGESQTSKTVKPFIDLFVVPETIIATTLIATLAAGGIFYLHKKRKQTPQIPI
jgi:hypothetical protein